MIFGPERTIERIDSQINAVTGDRIEDNAAVFDVFEIHGAILKDARLQPGRKTAALPDQAVQAGVILAGEHVRVRAVVCDHGIPSVAYAMDFPRKFSVRKKTLADSGRPPGPWLGRLKKSLSPGQTAADIRLPDVTIKPAGDLAEKLMVARPGKTLVYAADMADTPQNLEKLTDLALGAHTLFCEAAFTAADRSRAEASQHLTTTAPSAIARKAGVEQLVPFHFSKRYEHDPDAVYREIRAAAGPVKILGHYPQKKMEKGRIPVIGVAKSGFPVAAVKSLFRGGSRRPLSITAAGMPLHTAAGHIARMHGPYRMPTLLRQLDRIAPGERHAG